MQPATFSADNFHGRRTIPGARAIITTRELRALKANRRLLMHRTKNGVYDPLTFYHILDTLLDILPGETFRALELVELLRATRDQLVWDTTTVGRVVTDLAESLSEANGRPSIHAIRRWNGQMYSIEAAPECRAAMENLLADLAILCEAEIEAELAGAHPKRVESPLIRCPSVMLVSDH